MHSGTFFFFCSCCWESFKILLAHIHAMEFLPFQGLTLYYVWKRCTYEDQGNFARLCTLWLPYDIKPDQLKYNKHHITLLETSYSKTMALFQSSSTGEILKWNLGRGEVKKTPEKQPIKVGRKLISYSVENTFWAQREQVCFKGLCPYCYHSFFIPTFAH